MKPDDDVRMVPPTFNQLAAAVGAPVVDEDDLARNLRVADSLDDLLQRGSLIEHGNDDGKMEIPWNDRAALQMSDARIANHRWLREIKKRHLAHHFHSERGNFGITNGLWDRVLGTFYAQMKDVERSPTTFNLGYTGAEREAYPWVAELSASEDELTARRQRRRAAA